MDTIKTLTRSDNIHILMTHQRGVGSKEIHGLAWEAFKAGTAVAKAEGLYGAGQDLLKDSFSGNVKGLGPGVAEMEIEDAPLRIRPNQVRSISRSIWALLTLCTVQA